MKKWLLLLFISTAALADARHELVGKWKLTSDALTGYIAFAANGKITMSAQKASMKRGATGTGTYKWVDDSTIEMQVMFDRVPKVNRARVSVSGDTLELTDERGETQTLHRQKK